MTASNERWRSGACVWCVVVFVMSEQEASAGEDGSVRSVSLLPGPLPLQSHRERRLGCSVSSAHPPLHCTHLFCLSRLVNFSRFPAHESKMYNVNLSMSRYLLHRFCPPSAGERITVIDDSDEEWWRVSPVMSLFFIFISFSDIF